MKLLLANPNSTDSMTEKVRLTAMALLPDNADVVAMTNKSGPASIQGPEDGELAVPGMLNDIRRAIECGVDAVVIACFDDTGIEQARQLSPVPVIGIGQAAYHLSMLRGWRFSVVTTLSVSIPVLEQNIQKFGVYPYCCQVRASEVPVLDLEKPGSEAQRRISEEISRAVDEDRCDAIVLGCAGMTDLARTLSDEHQIPVIDGVAAATCLAYSLALSRQM